MCCKRFLKKHIHAAGIPWLSGEFREVVERTLICFTLVVTAELEHRKLRTKRRDDLRDQAWVVAEGHCSDHLQSIGLCHVARGVAMVGMCRLVSKHAGKCGLVVDKAKQSC